MDLCIQFLEVDHLPEQAFHVFIGIGQLLEGENLRSGDRLASAVNHDTADRGAPLQLENQGLGFLVFQQHDIHAVAGVTRALGHDLVGARLEGERDVAGLALDPAKALEIDLGANSIRLTFSEHPHLGISQNPVARLLTHLDADLDAAADDLFFTANSAELTGIFAGFGFNRGGRGLFYTDHFNRIVHLRATVRSQEDPDNCPKEKHADDRRNFDAGIHLISLRQRGLHPPRVVASNPVL